MTPSSRPTIGLVLVNWNSGTLTLDCLTSVRAGTRQPDRIVVIDNASTDGSTEALQRPDVDLVRLNENLGFTGANNLGIQRLRESGMDLIWILNNDTTVAPDCLAALEAALLAREHIAVTTARILVDQPPGTLWYAGGYLDATTLNGVHRGFYEKDGGQFSESAEVSFVCGCCMLVGTAVFAHIGVFDDRFFAYGEDVEWSHRARRAGLRMLYVPEATLHHHVSASVRRNSTSRAGLVSPMAHRLLARNQLFVIRLHAPSRVAAWRAYAAFARENTYLLAGLTLRGRWDKLRSRLRGIREGLTRDLRAGERGGRNPEDAGINGERPGD